MNQQLKWQLSVKVNIMFLVLLACRKKFEMLVYCLCKLNFTCSSFSLTLSISTRLEDVDINDVWSLMRLEIQSCASQITDTNTARL